MPRLPKIVIGQSDFDSLSGLASEALGRVPAAEQLLSELERAKIVTDKALPADAVRMGSAVVFRAGEAEARQVEIVYPGKADIAQSRISVLTPIGAALIGLCPGQSIRWTARDGRDQSLTVISVGQAAAMACA